MDWLAGVLEQTDSGWKILAIFLIGIYVLLWKFGGELLKLSRESNSVAKAGVAEAKAANDTVTEVHRQAQQISENIITNHGSKNLGDAIDRLTEWMLLHMHEQRATDTAIAELRAELVLHCADAAIQTEKVRHALTSLDDRLDLVEHA